MPTFIARACRLLPLLSVVAAGASLAQPAPEQVSITNVLSGLSAPLGIANARDGSDRLFIVQQGGSVRVARNNALLPTPFVTISGTTQCRATPGGALAQTGFTGGGERGLLGLAFHPGYASNGHVYFSYTDVNGDSIVVRMTAADPAADELTATDQATCLEILRVDQDFTNHNGGNILFGPGGYLYFGLGDGGSGGDPCNRGQTLNPANLNNASNCASDASFTDPNGDATPDRPAITRALLGKLLRIDVDGVTAAGSNGLCGARLDGAANYAIPGSNPFNGADPASACDEVWSYGLRNPWRFSFDRLTDDLYIGDVGQDQWEEVSFEAAGALGGTNFGWDVCEGTRTQGSCTTTCALAGATPPIFEYNNSGNGCSSLTSITGCSVTGGYRYRGPDNLLQGVYFFGDACNTRFNMSTQTAGVWSTPTTATQLPPTPAAALAGTVLAFGESEVGELYLVAGSTLYRVGAAAPPGSIFADSFE